MTQDSQHDERHLIWHSGTATGHRFAPTNPQLTLQFLPTNPKMTLQLLPTYPKLTLQFLPTNPKVPANKPKADSSVPANNPKLFSFCSLTCSLSYSTKKMTSKIYAHILRQVTTKLHNKFPCLFDKQAVWAEETKHIYIWMGNISDGRRHSKYRVV